MEVCLSASLWVFCLAFLYALLPVLSVEGLGGTLECYCTGCENNRCTVSDGYCAVQVREVEVEGDPRLTYGCRETSQGCTSVLSRQYYLSCCASSPLCNECLLPDSVPETLRSSLALPSGCPAFNLSSTAPPPAPETSTRANFGNDDGEDEYFIPGIVIITIVLILIIIVLVVGIAILIYIKRSRTFGYY